MRAEETDLSRQIGLTRVGRNHAMAITYYKRFRMEIDLNGADAMPSLPRGYQVE